MFGLVDLLVWLVACFVVCFGLWVDVFGCCI